MCFLSLSVGLDCELESSVLLQPGASSLELPWSCEVPDDALAGTNAFSFRAVLQVLVRMLYRTKSSSTPSMLRGTLLRLLPSALMTERYRFLTLEVLPPPSP